MILESFGKMSLSLDSQDLKLQKGLFLNNYKGDIFYLRNLMQIQINTWQLQTGWFHPYMEDFFEYISLSAIWTADCEWNCMVEEIRAIVSPPIQFSSFLYILYQI